MAFPRESRSLWIEHQIACPRASSWSEKGERQDLYSLGLQHVAFRELQLARWKVRVWNTISLKLRFRFLMEIVQNRLPESIASECQWRHGCLRRTGGGVCALVLENVWLNSYSYTRKQTFVTGHDSWLVQSIHDEVSRKYCSLMTQYCFDVQELNSL